MCPICWAAALASFAPLVAISAFVVAANDRLCVTAALALGIISLLHQIGSLIVAWWCLGGLMAFLTGRVAFLLLARGGQTPIVNAWRRARDIAANRCPSKPRQTPAAKTGNGGGASLL